VLIGYFLAGRCTPDARRSFTGNGDFAETAEIFANPAHLPIDEAPTGSQTSVMARRIVIETFLMIVAGIILALIGPFGSYELPLVQRLILWPLMILCGYPIFGGLGAVARWLAEAARIPYAVTIALGLIVGAMPMTLLVMLLWRRTSLDQALQSPILGPLYLQVLVIGVIIYGAMYLLFRPGAAPEPMALLAAPPTPQPVAAVTADGTAASLTPTSLTPTLPLPPGFGAVRALKGEDHYVRVIGDGRE